MQCAWLQNTLARPCCLLAPEPPGGGQQLRPGSARLLASAQLSAPCGYLMPLDGHRGESWLGLLPPPCPPPWPLPHPHPAAAATLAVEFLLKCPPAEWAPRAAPVPGLRPAEPPTDALRHAQHRTETGQGWDSVLQAEGGIDGFPGRALCLLGSPNLGDPGKVTARQGRWAPGRNRLGMPTPLLPAPACRHALHPGPRLGRDLQIRGASGEGPGCPGCPGHSGRYLLAQLPRSQVNGPCGLLPARSTVLNAHTPPGAPCR